MSRAVPLETVLRSATQQVVIGHETRFCLIGERINPTGRRIFQEQLRAGDLSAIERDVKAQVEGGADVLDINMGVPLTDEADLLARAAHGRADDLLTATLLTARCPVLMAPAMHTEMWLHPATRDNVALLRSRGVVVMEPASGRLTGADTGPGRLPSFRARKPRVSPSGMKQMSCESGLAATAKPRSAAISRTRSLVMEPSGNIAAASCCSVRTPRT